MHFIGLTLTVISSFFLFATASPVFGAENIARQVTAKQLQDWLATTDANITYIGQPVGSPSDLSKRQLPQTTVVFCTSQSGALCGGSCSMYTGGPSCIAAPSTACLMATRDVSFCDRSGCGGSCNQFNSCGTRLDGGFCSTPGTSSILVAA
ncbi:hypothetical protein CVT26_005866 [Gymnopilus dilepis]|uniref:Uncharacterized protein n=1 Tax=Gymnopilus dilepis TaxID=231916 RepID=A0A409Y1J7_9AGAR|nr:hypothetical protein CVT26_005866 [Gymnopilus dilepis]